MPLGPSSYDFPTLARRWQSALPLHLDFVKSVTLVTQPTQLGSSHGAKQHSFNFSCALSRESSTQVGDVSLCLIPTQMVTLVTQPTQLGSSHGAKQHSFNFSCALSRESSTQVGDVSLCLIPTQMRSAPKSRRVARLRTQFLENQHGRKGCYSRSDEKGW